MLRVLVNDALAQMKAAGWAPIAFPAYTDGRGGGVVKKNLDGIHVTHQNGADGWIEEVSYWYWTGKTSACRACGGPSGQVCVLVAPVTAVQIMTRGQAERIARAWKLGRAPRPGRIVKYPYGREIRRRSELGSLHPSCMTAVLSRRGWNVDGMSGSDADPRLPSVEWSNERDETVAKYVRSAEDVMLIESAMDEARTREARKVK